MNTQPRFHTLMSVASHYHAVYAHHATLAEADALRIPRAGLCLSPLARCALWHCYATQARKNFLATCLTHA